MMTDRKQSRSEDREWIERVERAYAPAKLTSASKARLDAELWSRVEERRRGAWVPVLAGALGVALVALVTLGGYEQDPTPATQVAATSTTELDTKVWAYLFELETRETVVDEEPWIGGDALPREYQAISDLLLEG